MHVEPTPEDIKPAKRAAKMLLTERLNSPKGPAPVYSELLTDEVRRILEPLNGEPIADAALAEVTKRVAAALGASASLGMLVLIGGYQSGVVARDDADSAREALDDVVDACSHVLPTLFEASTDFDGII